MKERAIYTNPEPVRRQWTADEIEHYWFKQRQELERLRQINASVPVRALHRKTKILRASNDFMEGFALFEGFGMGWRCVETSPAFRWMKEVPSDRLKVELLRRGMRWEWSNEFTDAPSMSRGSDSAGEGTSKETADSNEGRTRPHGSAPPTPKIRGPMESPRCSGLARAHVVTAQPVASSSL